jgi:WD40 repeat protein/mono/diheme cytochrome c family protein
MTPSFMNMMSSTPSRRLLHSFRAALLLGATALSLTTTAMVSAADPEKPKDTGGKTVSYYREVVPILKRSCSGCHHPAKLKGQLDLTSYEAFKKGGKHGAGFVAGKPKESIVVDEISGSEPSMPKEGDALAATEIALIERWILDGANDDTPAGAGSLKLTEAPVYAAPPVISALAFSHDGSRLAVSGYHEVLMLAGAESNITARLVGESPRIESLAFSPDGTRLAVAASAPALFGEVQIWDAKATGTTFAPQKAFKVALDSVYGISWSPEGDRLAFGGADKSVRIISAADGKELLKFDNHSDWVFATGWTTNGQRIISGSRDRAIKLIDAKTSQFIDDINKLLEGVLCFARHPKEDLVAYGGDLGVTRIYKIAENQGRTAANNDSNIAKEFDRMPGAVQAIAYAPDGKTICVGSMGGEARIYNTDDRKRVASLKGHEGAIFAIAYHPTTNQVVTGGYDGRLRVFETAKGELVRSFVPVPLRAPPTVQQAASR